VTGAETETANEAETVKGAVKGIEVAIEVATGAEIEIEKGVEKEEARGVEAVAESAKKTGVGTGSRLGGGRLTD
jgi:hypothetical protein